MNYFAHESAIIDDGCIIENNVSVCDGVRIYSNVFIGTSVVFMNMANRRAGERIIPQYDYKATFINQGVLIGANATIYCGVTISEDVLPGDIVRE